MSKMLSLTALGLVSAGLTLAVPETSQAQSFGLSINVGRGGFGAYHGSRYSCDYDYGSGFGYGSGYGRGYGSGYGYAPGYGYGSWNGNSYGYDGYGDHYQSRRSVIVHPEYEHWTPGRGWHSHGHIHVPHRGHYHTHRY